MPVRMTSQNGIQCSEIQNVNDILYATQFALTPYVVHIITTSRHRAQSSPIGASEEGIRAFIRSLCQKDGVLKKVSLFLSSQGSSMLPLSGLRPN